MENLILHQTPLSEIEAIIEKVVSKQFQSVKLTPQPEKEEKLFSRLECSKLLGISLPTLHEYTKKGFIQAVRIGSRVRYRKQDIDSALRDVVTTKR